MWPNAAAPHARGRGQRRCSSGSDAPPRRSTHGRWSPPAAQLGRSTMWPGRPTSLASLKQRMDPRPAANPADGLSSAAPTRPSPGRHDTPAASVARPETAARRGRLACAVAISGRRSRPPARPGSCRPAGHLPCAEVLDLSTSTCSGRSCRSGSLGRQRPVPEEGGEAITGRGVLGDQWPVPCGRHVSATGAALL